MSAKSTEGMNPSNFERLAPYNLTGVKASGRELGRGSYATVLELDYLGLRCAGKKIHDELLLQGDSSYAVIRFQEECRLLSQVRHPNIVQFLGVYFQQDEIVPILVMEFLPINLTSCIEQYGILPKEISYSILHDVAVGLCYLHSQTPPIIHRDLSSNNVLLTPNMTAKISDLGVARILNMAPLEVSHMTGTPGTPAYMPPEVMIADPMYNMSIDIFSFGILLIHVLSGKWPEPEIGPNQIDPETDRLVPVSEAERRETLLKSIGHDHPLMDLILKCIDNNPKHRPPSSNAVESMKEMISTLSTSIFANRLDILAHIEADEEEKRSLRMDQERKLEAMLQKDKQIVILEDELQRKGIQKSEEFSKLRVAHSTEVEQQRLLIEDMVSQIQGLHMEKQSITQKAKTALNEKEVLAAQMSKLEREVNATLKSFEEKLHQERKKQQQELAREKQRYERLLQEERDLHDKASAQNLTLQAEVHMLKSKGECLNSSLLAKDDIIASKESELGVKARILRQKDTTISGMSEQLTAARKFLATTQQSFQTSIMWSKCADMPIEISTGNATVINGKVFFGGGLTSESEECTIYCYNQLQPHWSTLPLFHYRHMGLGQIEGKLVAIGGAKQRPSRERTNEVYMFIEGTGKWRKAYPPMPTARSSTVVVSLESTLIVAGGYSYWREKKASAHIVEVFKVNELQWYRASKLPIAGHNMSGVVLNTELYFIGGIEMGATYSQVLCSSVADLINNAVPWAAHEGTQKADTSDITHVSSWKMLPDTPTNKTAVTSLAGSLITLGGEENAIHMFSPIINSWVHVGSLPAPRLLTTISVLSPIEILMIGGFDGSKNVNTVYKGTLQLSK